MIEQARTELGDWDQVGKGARFFDDAPRRSAKQRTPKPKPPAKPKGKVQVKPAHDKFEPLGGLRFDFESDDDPMEGWKIISGTLAQPVSSVPSLPKFKDRPFNRHGARHLSTVATAKDEGASDQQVAVVASPTFLIKGEKVAFLLSGGGPGTRVAFVNLKTGEEFISTEGPRGPQMKRYVVDIPPAHRNQPVRIRVIDQARSNWGHICFDDFSADGSLK